jgi:hypothetical protein
LTKGDRLIVLVAADTEARQAKLIKIRPIIPAITPLFIAEIILYFF